MIKQIRTALLAVQTFFNGLSRPIALNALFNLLAVFGGISLFAYFATMHYYLIIPSTAVLFTVWFLIYKIEFGIRTRRTFGVQS